MKQQTRQKGWMEKGQRRRREADREGRRKESDLNDIKTHTHRAPSIQPPRTLSHTHTFTNVAQTQRRTLRVENNLPYESIIHFSGRNDSITLCDLNRLHCYSPPAER